MKKVLVVAGIAALVAIIGMVTIGAVVFAQDGDEGANWPFDFRDRMRTAVADILGITIDEYDSAIDQAQGQVMDDAVAEGWLTQEQADKMQEQLAEKGDLGSGMMGPDGFGHPGGKGRDSMGHGGFMAGPNGGSLSAVADALDMTTEELMTELRDGKTIADVAAEKGVDTQVIVDAYLTQLSEKLTQAVEDGRITQARADWTLEQAKDQITKMLDESFEGTPYNFRQDRRPGKLEDLPGQDDA